MSNQTEEKEVREVRTVDGWALIDCRYRCEHLRRENERLRELLATAIKVVNPVTLSDWHKQAREALAAEKAT